MSVVRNDNKGGESSRRVYSQKVQEQVVIVVVSQLLSGEALQALTFGVTAIMHINE